MFESQEKGSLLGQLLLAGAKFQTNKSGKTETMKCDPEGQLLNTALLAGYSISMGSKTNGSKLPGFAGMWGKKPQRATSSATSNQSGKPPTYDDLYPELPSYEAAVYDGEEPPVYPG